MRTSKCASILEGFDISKFQALTSRVVTILITITITSRVSNFILRVSRMNTTLEITYALWGNLGIHYLMKKGKSLVHNCPDQILTLTLKQNNHLSKTGNKIIFSYSLTFTVVSLFFAWFILLSYLHVSYLILFWLSKTRNITTFWNWRKKKLKYTYNSSFLPLYPRSSSPLSLGFDAWEILILLRIKSVLKPRLRLVSTDSFISGNTVSYNICPSVPYVAKTQHKTLSGH